MHKVKIGILGTRRGLSFAEAATVLPDAEVVALCGRDRKRLEFVGNKFGIKKLYTSYEDMLNDPDIDAVIVANYADQHVKPSCQALRAGKAVMSEVPACVTIAEAIELIETVESTGKTYMFGENFCYMAFVQEMRRLYENGDLGELTYAEGEYVHFARKVACKLIDLSIKNHWRTWIYPTFYITHSIGPLLRITGLRPVAVMAATGHLNSDGKIRQAPSVELVRLENGAIVKSLHGSYSPREPWQPCFMVGGTKGCVENNRWPDPNKISLYLDKDEKIRTYRAEFPEYRQEAASIQHWGADLFLVKEFVKSVRTGSKPDINVYMGIDMSLCGNLAWRSVLAGGGWVDIPDLRDPEERKKWRNDFYSCRPGTPEKYLMPNNALTGRTDTLSGDALEKIRKAQELESYTTSIYRD